MLVMRQIYVHVLVDLEIEEFTLEFLLNTIIWCLGLSLLFFLKVLTRLGHLIIVYVYYLYSIHVFIDPGSCLH